MNTGPRDPTLHGNARIRNPSFQHLDGCVARRCCDRLTVTINSFCGMVVHKIVLYAKDRAISSVKLNLT